MKNWVQIEAIERSAALAGDLQRGSNVQQWAVRDGSSASLMPLFEVDARGDRNNVVYEGLYKMDVAAYKRVDPAGAAAGARPRQGFAYARYWPMPPHFSPGAHDLS